MARVLLKGFLQSAMAPVLSQQVPSLSARPASDRSRAANSLGQAAPGLVRAVEAPSPGGSRRGIGKAGNRACGAALRVQLVVEGANDRICSVTVEPIGHALEEVQAFLPLLLGRTASEALEIPPRELAQMVGGLPDSKLYCSVLLHEALRVAIADARGESHDAQGALTCTCYAVSEELLRRAIDMNGLRSVQEVRCFTKAGGGCGCCVSRVAAVISSVTGEPSREGPSLLQRCAG